ncbi:hypothetical protein Gotri_023972 [Gossypium trilobum]|uniref:RNase H type-1 domain-containing protein n=1 Tax=Gossypium trilobum TaxID=34281 RepID=A0A7J9DKM6_9ROSI|nr:hypothetical protein [Gossypium trilobum]
MEFKVDYLSLYGMDTTPFYGDPSQSYMVIDDCSWNLDFFRLWVNEDIINKIVGIPPPHSLAGPDRIIWGNFDKIFFSQKYGSRHLAARLVPSKNLIHLTTNGSVRIDDDFATIGGFVCDHNGEWIFGFNRCLGMCTVVDAELWGVLDGLKLTL